MSPTKEVPNTPLPVPDADGLMARPTTLAPVRTPLDEAYDFIRLHLDITDAQAVALTLWAAHTHALGSFYTTPRLLFTAEVEDSGKTAAMNIVAKLSSAPEDTAGTQYAVRAALAASSNVPDAPVPTLFRDEISDVFGQSGLQGQKDPIAGIIRKGYKRGATDSWSVNRVSIKIDIFTPFIMAGLKTAVPRDIRSRSISVHMKPGVPSQYFDVRTGEKVAAMYAAALSAFVRQGATALTTFRARGMHPKLVNRRLEVWEPILAVASLGGQSWLNRAVAAFQEIALDESDVAVLGPEQTALKDMMTVLNAGLVEMNERGEVLTSDLRDEIRRIDSGKLYATIDDMDNDPLSRLIRAAIGHDSAIVTVGSRRRRGYRARDIIAVALARLPADAVDVEVPDVIDLDSVDYPLDEGNEPVNTDYTDYTDYTDIPGSVTAPTASHRHGPRAV